MIKGIDSKAENGPSTALSAIGRLQGETDVKIAEYRRTLRATLREAEDTLLAVRALGRRILVEHPAALDVANQPNQSPVESEQ